MKFIKFLIIEFKQLIGHNIYIYIIVLSIKLNKLKSVNMSILINLVSKFCLPLFDIKNMFFVLFILKHITHFYDL